METTPVQTPHQFPGELPTRAAAGRVVDLTPQRVAPAVARGLQDILHALALAEAVYRVDADGQKNATQKLRYLLHQVPRGWNEPVSSFADARVHWSSNQEQRFCTVEGPDALYVCIMGSLHLSDWLTNVNIILDNVDVATMLGPSQPAAHRGYLNRARHIPVEALFSRARAHSKRLVLCGHSLGGAVATLCALRLLKQLPPGEVPNVSVIGFASPAVGNRALALSIRKAGWQNCFTNFLMPEDFVPRLMTPLRRGTPATAPSLVTIAAMSSQQQPAKPPPQYANNVQPFIRRLRHQQARVRGAPVAAQAAPIGEGPAGSGLQPGTTLKSSSNLPEAADGAVSMEVETAGRWHLLRHAVTAGPTAVWGFVYMAFSPLVRAIAAATSYVPLGNEVHLLQPRENVHLFPFTASLLCPAAHRMPSYRARIFDIIYESLFSPATTGDVQPVGIQQPTLIANTAEKVQQGKRLHNRNTYRTLTTTFGLGQTAVARTVDFVREYVEFAILDRYLEAGLTTCPQGPRSCTKKARVLTASAVHT